MARHLCSWAFNVPGKTALRHASLRDFTIADALGERLEPRALDLLEVVAAVHTVDRAERRPSSALCGASWSRSLAVQVGVRDPDLWSSDRTRSLLHELLAWLTDDNWNMEFVQRSGRARSGETVQFLFETPQTASAVALFSGGLDSVAGLVADIEAGTSPIAVSVTTNNRMATSQRKTLAVVNEALSTRVAHVAVPLHLVGGEAPEKSQRARGFSFLGLGAVAAHAAGTDRIHVYENGVGAINLPYTAGQTGAHNTRAMHPRTLEIAANLFSLLFETDFIVENRSAFETKAQMCMNLPESVASMVSATSSCDGSYTRRTAGSKECGLCTSCLLRRQALFGAGIDRFESAGAYRADAFRADDVAAPDLYELRAMLGQAASIREALSEATPWSALVRAFPTITHAVIRRDPFGDDATRRALVEMYRRYVDEWQRVPSPLVRVFLAPTIEEHR